MRRIVACAVLSVVFFGGCDTTPGTTDDELLAERTREFAGDLCWLLTTDELAAAPYDAIGVDGCARLRELIRPVSVAVSAAFG